MNLKQQLHCIEQTIIAVNAGKVYAPKELRELIASTDNKAAPLMDYINGCGSSLHYIDFVPDTIFGVDVCASCGVHDFMYTIGKTEYYKTNADTTFRNNLIRQVAEGLHGKWYRNMVLKPALKRIDTYHYMVSNYGGPSFWDNKEQLDTVTRIQL